MGQNDMSVWLEQLPQHIARLLDEPQEDIQKTGALDGEWGHITLCGETYSVVWYSLEIDITSFPDNLIVVFVVDDDAQPSRLASKITGVRENVHVKITDTLNKNIEIDVRAMAEVLGATFVVDSKSMEKRLALLLKCGVRTIQITSLES